jgi:hypothetical protein
MLNIIVFAIGWLLFVAAQCKNSLNSKTNSLVGWPGVKSWLLSQSVNLATRAFFSALGYGFLVHTVAAKIDAVGFHLTSTTISGFAGYGANGMLYQLFGLLPWLRVEVADLAPPANAQIVPPTALPANDSSTTQSQLSQGGTNK